MSEAEQRRREHHRRVQSELKPDVGPVEDDDGDCRHCDEDAVYRVPWPHFGGDAAYCSYHLARYRQLRPETWAQIRDLDVDDPVNCAAREQRFLLWDEVPPKIRDGAFHRVALSTKGHALYELTRPDEDDRVTYLTVDRTLDEQDSIRVPRSRAGEFLTWYRETVGWHAVSEDVEWALYGGEL
jgi:hypothetical protein